MSTTVAGQEVRRYLEAVRAQLADLAPDDRDELLEDLEDHLLEVAAEDDGTLEQRLGSPRAYAEELRASAGLTSGGRARHRGVAERARRSRVIRRSAHFAQWARRSRRFQIGLLLVAVLGSGIAIGRASVAPYFYSEPEYGVVSQPFLHHADGTTIANICPYSTDGKLLTGVLLFDQFGRPITNTGDSADGRPIEQATPAILNVYPKTISWVEFQRKVYDENDGTEQVQKSLTPLACPASVTAGPAQPSPIPSTGP